MHESEPPAPEHPDPEIEALLDFTPVERHTRRHDGWPPERQRGFVAALVTLGNVDRAAHSQGRTASGAYKVRTSAGAEGFADAWDGALALYHRRNPRRAPKGRPSRGEIRAGSGRAWPEAPAAPPPADPQAEERAVEEGFDEILVGYLMKLDAEREARLGGRIIEADFYVRQIAWLEVALALGGRGAEVLEAFRRMKPGGRHAGDVVATPVSVLLDRVRRAYWAEQGDPERPPLPPLGRHDGELSTGEPLENQYCPDRDGERRGWELRRLERAALAAQAQQAWEEKARVDAAAWAKRVEAGGAAGGTEEGA